MHRSILPTVNSIPQHSRIPHTHTSSGSEKIFHLSAKRFTQASTQSHRHTTMSSSICSASTKPILITFDVDGTLVRSVGQNANKLHKEAFQHAFHSVFGIDTTIDVIEHHGSTDGLILVNVMEHHGVDREEALGKLIPMKEAMVDYFARHKERARVGIEVLPGVEKLLETLQNSPRVHIGLCTGNLEPIAWMKMESLGLKRYFEAAQDRIVFGGFGSDFCDPSVSSSANRAQLVRQAAVRAAKDLGVSDGFARKFHVGDAPMDIQAALMNEETYALGVLTGIFDRQQLEDAAAHISVEQLGTHTTILESLEDTEKVLDVILHVHNP
jgi:phosphoglycolate phosphatase